MGDGDIRTETQKHQRRQGTNQAGSQNSKLNRNYAPEVNLEASTGFVLKKKGVKKVNAYLIKHLNE